MQRLLISLALIAIVIMTSFAGEKQYGKALTLKQQTSVNDIYANPKKYDGKKVLIEGTITEVCQDMGCWITIAHDSLTPPMKFKVKDGEIVFPKDAKGKAVLAEGTVSIKTMTKEEVIKERKHEAEEQGKKFDPSTVKGPEQVIMIKGDGARIR